MLQLAKHIHAKFHFSNFYPDGLRQILDQFSSKFQNFLEKISKFSNSEEIQTEHRKRHLLPKFKPASIFTKISKVILIFFTPEFALEISKFQSSV
jgi:hypothetical protein